MFPKRTANIILTSSHAEIAPALHCAFQLACVNRKISEMSRSSNADVHSIFAEAAFLAGRAIEAATELQRVPGMSVEVFADTLGFDAACGTSPKSRHQFTWRKQHARGSAGHIPLALLIDADDKARISLHN